MADALMSEAEVEELIERTRHALDAVAEVGVLARRADARGPAADVDEPRRAQSEACVEIDRRFGTSRPNF